MFTTNQFGHSATLLRNGKVLISRGTIIGVGGFLQPAPPELYDPVTAVFTQAGDVNGNKEGSAATLLQDGRVLLTGGWNTGDASLYDPNFSITTLGNLPIWSHIATLLANGTVLVAGGVFFNGSDAYKAYGVESLAASQIYDPGLGTFTVTGPMFEARDDQTATLLASGLVLIAGGDWNYSRTLASAELYDPTVGTFRPIGNMTTSRWRHSATLLPDGTVLITGGTSSYWPYVALASAELYVPSGIALPSPAPVLPACEDNAHPRVHAALRAGPATARSIRPEHDCAR